MNFNFKTQYSISLKIFFVCFVSISLLSSCASYKKIPYFQDLDRTRIITTDLNNYSSLTIQPQDQISVLVGSLNPEAAAVFNNNLQNAITSANSTYGYKVDKNGEIKLPLVGKMKVSGLTTDDLALQLQQSLLPYLKEPTVTVRIVNFKIAVLGDVIRPNIYTSASERFTITEALSLAGDLDITGKRQEITLVREIDGKRIYVPIDLTSKEVFESPYFYLKSNDLIFVQTGKLKLDNADTGWRNAGIILSALSLVAITISIFHK